MREDSSPGSSTQGGSGRACARRTSIACLATFTETEQSDAPFRDVPAADAADAVWVRPELVGEIEFSGWTGTGVARHPRWRGIRSDVDPADVRREE